MSVAQKSPNRRLLLTETKGFLDTENPISKDHDGRAQVRVYSRNRQLLLQGLVALVSRKIDSVETGVRLWQLVDLASLFNGEPSWSIGSLQVLESVDWDSRGTSGELQ